MTDYTTSDRQSAGCDAFDASLADYLDGTLDPGSRAAADAHLASCDRCTSLVGDLEAITLQARALPPILPTAETTSAMWTGISRRIDAPVVSLGDKRAAVAETRPSGVWLRGWRRMGAAAAALVLVTAGVTYKVTTSFDAPRTPPVAVGDTAPAATPPAPGVRSGSGAPAAPQFASASPLPDTAAAAIGRGDSARPASVRERRGTTQFVTRLSPIEATYEREIAGLRRIVRERRGELDSATVAVLEQNLRVIDEAIRQSRAALARDPRSRFLNQQLNNALDQKVELLRMAALLPART